MQASASVQAAGSLHLWLCAQDSPACFHCAEERPGSPGGPKNPPTLTRRPQGAQSRLPRGRSLQAAAVEPRSAGSPGFLGPGEAGPRPGQMLTEKAGSESPPCPGGAVCS